MNDFKSAILDNEVQLRGRVMTASADLEMLLLRIILYCVIESPEDILREYKTMTLEVKINMANKDLLEFRPLTHPKYKALLKDLQRICKFRNRFAHCTMLWDKKEKDASYFNLITITEVGGMEHLQPMKVTVKDFNQKLLLMMDTIIKLAHIAEEIETAFNDRFPNYFKGLGIKGFR